MAVAMRPVDIAAEGSGYAVVIPFVRSPRPAAQTYVRRRVIAGLIILGVVALLAVALGAMTGRGGDPASATTARPEAAAATPAPAQRVYVVRAGDTLWSIAGELRGTRSQRDFVEALIKINGGTRILAGQALHLPAARG